jgi:chromosome segregation ATPase
MDATTAQVDPFDGTPDGVTADPRPAGFLQERAEVAERLAHLEEMQVRNERTMADQAKLIGELTESIRIVRGHRDELMQELTGARVIIEARDSRVVQLESALERRNGQLADATEAAEEYRAELKRVLESIAALAHSTLGDD